MKKIILMLIIIPVVLIVSGFIYYQINKQPLRRNVDNNYLCPNGTVALEERLDSLRFGICIDCVTKTAYICGDKFWIHEYGGIPGNIENKWSGPYEINKLEEFKEPPLEKDETADFTPSEVEGWQIYRNEEYGFEIKYPDFFRETTEELGDELLYLKRDGHGCISHIDVKEMTIEELLTIIESHYDIYSKEEILVNNYEGVKVTFGEGESEAAISILLPHNSKVYSIDYCKMDDFEEIFDQILSTFRFIE